MTHLGNVDHCVHVVLALDEGEPSVLPGHNRHRAPNLSQGLLCVPSRPTFEHQFTKRSAQVNIAA